MKKENYEIIAKFENENWWYRAKRDLFNRILENMNKRFECALDLGCGVGSNFSILRKYSKEVIGVDNSDTSMHYCENLGYAELVKADALKTKFPDSSFDLILCSDVLEHLNDTAALKEIHRILKKEGFFIFSVPAHEYLWGPTDEISNHLRRYEKKKIIPLLKNKFDIIKLSYWNFLMFFPDLIFIKLLSLLNVRKKQKNALEYIPNIFNEIIYRLLLIENRIFIKANILQGVSLVGIAKKK